MRIIIYGTVFYFTLSLTAPFGLVYAKCISGAITGKNRSMYMAMFLSVTSVIGIGLGNSIGGWLLDNVLYKIESTDLPFTRYNMLYFFSVIVRVISAFVVLPRLIQEENSTPIKEIFKDLIYDINIFRHLRNRFGK